MLAGQPPPVNGATTVVGGGPFDQGTSNVSFRFNAYPTLALDGTGRIYLAWSERGIGPGGDARIMLATASEDKNLDFSALSPVDNPATRGHQLMPSLTFAGGKLVLVYYELREDSSDAQYTPLGGGQYSKTEVPVGDLAPPNPQPAKVFNNFIADAAPAGYSPIQRRHTIDVRASQANPGKMPVFSASVQVSDYLFGSRPGSTLIEQLQFNPPNLPMFAMGTVPFFGDYIDVAPAPAFVPGLDGTWKYNAAATPAPVFHAVWTDNRDVRPPLDGDWTHYTPPFSPSVQGNSLFDPTQQVPNCVTGQEGMRNQNIYSARITQGLLAGSLGNSKPLGNATLPDGRVVQIQRGFVVFVQNARNSVADYRLTITNQPAGGKASLLQFPVAGQPDPLTQLDVEIAPLSTVSRTVFISAPDPKASVLVTVQEINAIGGTPIPPSAGGLQSSVLLNPDITNPSISNPSISNPSISNPSISNAEVFNPSISNPSISNPNISNPSISNPSISNPSISNVTVANPDIANPSISNVDILNPSISNPDLANPSISNPSISNAAMQDTTWTVTNDGNTAGSFNVNLLSGQVPPNTVVTQLLIHGIYTTPVAQACTLKQTTKTVLMANVTNPTFTSSGAKKTSSSQQSSQVPPMNTPSVPLAPGETVQITIRVLDPNPPAPGVVSFQPAKAVKPVVISQAVNTVDAANGVTQPPTAGGPISVTTTALLNAIVGANYLAVLQANGGYGARTWTIAGGGLPPGLTLVPNSGVITGAPVAAGLFTFTAQVQDSATPIDTATQMLNLLVVNPLLLSPSPLPAAQAGQAYSTTLVASGGFGAQTWSLPSGTLPSGLTLSSSGIISGTPARAGTSTFTVAVRDSNAPPQVASASFTIVVQAANSSLLSFVQQPSTAPVGQAVSPAVAVAAKNNHGAALPGVSITLAPQSNPSGATLSGASATTNGAGVASFPNLSLNKVGMGYTLVASASGFTGATSSSFAITPVGVNLSFTAQPGLSTGGKPIMPAVLVFAQDNSGAALPGVSITMALGANPCAGALGGTTTVATGPNGNAAFPNLAVSTGGAGYTLVASTTGATPITSNPFTVVGFCPTGSMASPREIGTITLLNSGQALLAGGIDATSTLSSATLYDPPTGSFLPTGSMNVAREQATATLLPNGKVLVAGGRNGNGATAAAELYDSASGTFTLTGSMATPRADATATLLPNGKVLIAGGFALTPTSVAATATAELFDPASGTFSTTGSLATGRWLATANLLPDGTVLVSGGFNVNNTPTAAAEIYNPATSTFSPTGSMSGARVGHTSTLLPNGKVLIADGFDSTLNAVSSVELYDPATGLFSPAGNMLVGRQGHIATLLPNGKVMFAGGFDPNANVTGTAELFDPVSGSFSPTGSLIVARSRHLAVLLATGNALLAGGLDTTGTVISSAELYLAFAAPPLNISTLALADGNVGQGYSATLQTTGGTGAVTWSRSGGTLPPGLTVSSAGVISGTPTTAGTFGFTLQATDSGTPAQTTYRPFSIRILNTSARLSFQTQPATVVAGQVMVPPAQVLVQNSSGPIVGQTVALALGNNPSGASLSGAIAVSGVGGIATFGVLSVSNFGTGYTLVASAPGFPGATSSAFNVLPVGAKLAFLVQPSNGTAGQPISPAVQVRAADMTGTPLAGVTVTLQFATNPGSATLSGATGVTNLSGIAAFPNLSVSAAGTGYAFLATAPNFTGATSNAFNILSPTPTLGFVVQPSNVTAGQQTIPAVQMLALDGTGAPISGATVTLSLGTNPCPLGTAGGMAPAAVTGANGIAAFTNLTFDHAGGLGFTIVASTPGLPSATSSPFNVIGFCPTGSMTDSRWFHTMTTLPNGKVLMTGGDNNSTGAAIASAELYDPSTGTFTATGSMNQARDSHSATLLPNGKVLIAGGYGPGPNFKPLTSAELYDPTTGAFTPTGNMNVDRGEHTATLLPSGKVLIAGGNANLVFPTNAELYDPSTGIFTPSAGTMVDGNRAGHRAVLLNNGTVLIAGGSGINGFTSSAEIYNPANDSFTATGSMTVKRYYPTATLLSSGKVLIDSGISGNGGNASDVNLTADLYDPASGAFAQSGSTTASHYGGVAGPLPGGDALVAGGGGGGVRNPLADIFDRGKGTFRPTASMKDARVFAASAPLSNGQILVTGGVDGPGNIIASAEFYVSSSEFSTVSLPDGVVSQPYNASFNGSGGTNPITVSLSSGVLPNGLTLSTNSKNTVISGTPTVPGLFTFTLTATDSGSPVQTDTRSFSIRIWSTAAAGASLSFVVQPTTAQAGLVIAPNVAVLAQTSGGPVTGLTVTLAIGTNPAGGTLSGATAVTGPSGIAVFPGLSINNVGPGYTLVASAPNFPGGVSNSFDVVPPTPILSFVSQPGTGTAFPVFLPPIKVKAMDGNGAPVPYVPISMTVGTNACPSFPNQPTAVATTDLTGTATFTNIRIQGGGAGWTLIASAFRGAAPVTSNPFNVIGFCSTGSMAVPRWLARSTLLPNGKVLVTGGASAVVPAATGTNIAEVYDPASGMFGATGNMSGARLAHSSTLLPSGLVLVAGGQQGSGVLSSAELYDPVVGTFSPTGSMVNGRSYPTATLLPSGKVLITGGFGGGATAELYDPVSGAFTLTGSMNVARAQHSATLLPSGKVLIIGGTDGASQVFASAEIYDPATGTFTPTGNMAASRSLHTATLLPNGQVLITGGSSTTPTFTPQATAELYAPSSGTFTPTGSMFFPRGDHAAKLLPNGKVLIVGTAGRQSEIYDPATGSFARTGRTFSPHTSAIGELLPSGNVLIAGGHNGVSAFTNAELFFPFAGIPLNVSTLALADGNVGQAYSATLQVTGGSGPLTWTLASGILPAGLSLNSAGVISGKPTTPGISVFAVQVTDSSTPPMSAMQPLSITVANTPGAGLSFTVQPTSTLVGQMMLPAVQVQVHNSGGPVVGQPVTLTLGNNPGGATLSGGSAVSGAGGLATFSNLSVNNPGFGYTLVASANGFTGATSTAFDIAPVGASLSFLVQPSNGVATLPIFPAVQVRAADGVGRGIAGLTITLGFGANPGGATLSGSTAVTNLAGIATFTNLTVSNAGNGYTLVASILNFTGATSNAFNIVPLGVTITNIPNSKVLVTAGQPVTPPPQWRVTDSRGTPMPNVTVTLSLIASPCPGATGQGNLTAMTDASGIATFTNATVSNGGWGYKAQASAAGATTPVNDLQGAQHDQFNVAGYCNSGSMATPRRFHTGTLLPNGLVLITGGDPNTSTSGTTSAELYNPLTRTFSPTGNMNTARAAHTATLLPNGKVLITGGRGPSGVLASAELYDPSSGTFTLTGSMSVARQDAKATLLPNGRVLITGGYPGPSSVPYPTGTTSAEIYDPATGSFASAGNMTVTRIHHAAVLLPNGKVLIVGGQSDPNTYLNSAEVYDPATNTFTATGSMSTARRGFSATLLPSGNVLAAGGQNTSGTLNSAEIYSPAGGSFSATGNMAFVRQFQAAPLLPSGLVLLVQGFAQSSELYNLVSGTFTQTGSRGTSRFGDAVVLLPDGSVLDAGGTDNNTSAITASAEVYFPQEPPFNRSVFGATGHTVVSRNRHTATVLPSGLDLLAGGDDNVSTSFASAELYNLLAGSFSSSAGTMSNQRIFHTATLLPTGNVLIAGGRDFTSNVWPGADLYNPSTDSFMPTGSLNAARYTHTATLLPNGKVLVSGGIGPSGGGLGSAELYDPASGSFTPTGNMTALRGRHTATLLPSGKVLIAGGLGNSSAEIYDPSTGTFTATGSMNTAHDSATSTLLPNGKVLIAGGFIVVGGNTVVLSSAELYDPAPGTFTVTGSLATARAGHSAILLPNGKALLAGGGNLVNATYSSAEVYDAASGLFSPARNMQIPRAQFTATLLPTGTILTVGGSGDTTADLFGPGPSSTLPAYVCSLESSLRSINGTTTAAIQFLNSSSITQNVYWLNYGGTRQLFATLAPGQSYVQFTFLTHPWVATDSSNTCRAIYLPTLESGVAVLF
ncbi:MAG TPA: kelch repeat-containing protein [Candidatus Acidoferrum sp.]|nr:kelch repeat-containing protein [Candidatus Acidoferrum sp.]